MNNKLILLAILTAFSQSCLAYDWIPERRQHQNPTQPAHLIVPLPYSKPGIGDGFVLMATVTNVAETTADITGLLVTGEVDGKILNGSEIPLYSDILFLDFYLQDINRAAINNYSIRGIGNTGQDDFTVLDLSEADETNVEFNLAFYERRLNFYYAYHKLNYQIDAIRSSDGALITALDEPFTNTESSASYRLALDFTDDYLDPRTGLRFDLAYQQHKAVSVNDPDFYTLNYNFLAYIPFADSDTLVLNYYQSDAHVTRIGNIDPDSIRAELAMNCAPADLQCLSAEQELVDNFINARSNGTSTTLGGDLRLRSFPQGRYQGAHTAFIGAEYRWNISQEVTPFDYFIWKDVRTGIQLALFAEIGTVSETRSQLWDESRHSIGAGFRLVAASGAVYRADIATGKEGAEVIIIFAYPWE